MKKRLLTFLFAASLSVVSSYADSSILSIKESISDSAIVYPESFETDTHKLMESWYLKNYAILDKDVEKKNSNDVSDEEYVKRLKAMPTEIEMPFNSIVKSYIKMYTQKRRTLVETMLGMSLYYMPIFEQALEKEGMPLELRYLPVIESALDPNAVSRVGATGLWQFMLRTAKGVGLEVNSLVDERRDPYRSSDKAAKYLKELHSIYGDWSLAIAAYNCGPGNVNKAIRRAGGSKKDFWAIYPFLPAETRGYVPAFIAANYVMTYHKYHNISPSLATRPLITDTIHVTKRVHLQQISDVLDIPLEEIQALNPHFRKNIIPGNSRPYVLTLPSQQIYSYIMSEDSIIAHDSKKYAQRDVVEPADYSKASKDTKLVVKYHKVKRGETLSSIARKYGVTTASIKKANNLKSNRVKRGRRLRINTYVRVEPEERQEDVVASAALSDSTQSESAKTNTDEVAQVREEQQMRYHKVKRGESLGKIADKYGISVNDIKKLNNLKSNNIQAGQRLKVTGEVPEDVADDDSRVSTHKVQPGESLGKIAAKYGTTVNKLKALNNLKSNNIRIGQVLKVTGNANVSVDDETDDTLKVRYHKVRKGESLGKIAARYGTTVKKLQRENNITGTHIDIGQRLKIPAK